MKATKSTLVASLAIAISLVATNFAAAQTVVKETVTTNTDGTISQFNPDTIVIRTETSAAPVEASAHGLDDPDQLVEPVAVAAGEADEVAGLLDDLAALRRARDGDAAAAAELEQALVAQRPERAEDGVRVDAEHGGEVPRRRQALSGLRLAVPDRAADLGRHLLVELGRLVPIDLDAEHGASNNSSIVEGPPQ